MSNSDSPSSPRARLIVTPTSRPALARHVKFTFDDVRQRWLILAPERLLTPSDTAVAVLKLCDGQTPVDQVASVLASEFEAPQQTILADIIPVLQDLADKGYLKA
jgi:pyrroloquinoline quinone biosynthesis protein D